jgi:hypothetical protein
VNLTNKKLRAARFRHLALPAIKEKGGGENPFPLAVKNIITNFDGFVKRDR